MTVSEAETGYLVPGANELSYEDAITTAVALLIRNKESFLEHMKKTEKVSPFPSDNNKKED